MAQQRKALATKPDDLNLTPRVHTAEGENWFPKFSDPYKSSMTNVYPPPYTK